MHLGLPTLLEFFRRHRDESQLAVATIVEVEGSTYRKRGAMMLAAADGRFEGLISGGCLENDLMHHMRRVIADRQPRRVEYDMHAGDDLVWNLGIGCDGIIRLLVQPLERADGFGFLSPLEQAQAQGQPAVLSLVVEEAALPLGSWCLQWGAEKGHSAGLAALSGLSSSAVPEGCWRTRRARLPGDRGEPVLQVCLPPPVRALICGAGPDAVPLAEAFAKLDWEVIVVDHRPAQARPDRFPGGCEVRCVRPGDWSVESRRPDVAVVMSHHLETDAAWLSALKPLGLAYVGVLGPRARRQRLAELSGFDEAELFGPVGLDIGAELPAAIALSAAAEVHAVLNGRDGRFLSRKA